MVVKHPHVLICNIADEGRQIALHLQPRQGLMDFRMRIVPSHCQGVAKGNA